MFINVYVSVTYVSTYHWCVGMRRKFEELSQRNLCGWYANKYHPDEVMKRKIGRKQGRTEGRKTGRKKEGKEGSKIRCIVLLDQIGQYDNISGSSKMKPVLYHNPSYHFVTPSNKMK